MKDSNAAPSPNTPASNASRGKVAAPKARAKAVSKAKARAKAKNVAPQKNAAPAVNPKSEVTLSETEVKCSETEVKRSETENKFAESRVTLPETEIKIAETKNKLAENEVKRSETENKLAENGIRRAETKVAVPETKVTLPETVTPEILFPEILFPEALAPKVVSPKTSGLKPDGAPRVATSKSVAPRVTPVNGATSPGANSQPARPLVASSRAATSRKWRPLTIFAALAALILTISGGVAVGSYNNWSSSRVIAPKVRIAGEPIGGMTRDQAVAHLNHRFGKLAFTLQTGEKTIVLGLADAGGKPSIEPTVDKAFAIGRSGNLLSNFTRVFGSEIESRSFSLPVEWNRGALTSRLQIVNHQFSRLAVDARLIAVSGAAPRVTGEQSGRALDVSATADAIQKSYFLGLSKIAAVTSAVEPKVTSADLAGRDVKLGQYRTEYNSGIAGRTTNIHVACRAIDGTVLMPGEVLSFNRLTGERTYEKGYRMAHIFLREAGQTESSVVDGLAGGVCQVSSTLYNAVRNTNAQVAGKPLSIVERSSHSLPVTYVPSGRDATVAWPGKDFRFRNNNNFPVYVRTDANDGRLTISIWGRVPQNQAVPVSMKN